MVVEDRISVGFPLIEQVARQFARLLPPGVTLDDLQSLGGEALMKANDKFDPAGGARWEGYVVNWLKLTFRSFLRDARKKAARNVPLDIETKDGDLLPRPDPRAEDPGERAGRREVRRRGRAAVSMEMAKAQLPAPDKAAEKAQALRLALFAGISAADMTAVAKAMVQAATGGDVKAAKLLVDLVAPAKITQQVAVIIPPAPDDDD